MDGTVDIDSKQEKALTSDLDKCAFVFGDEFAKIIEKPRTVAAARGEQIGDKAQERETNEATEESARTRVHIDLGEKTSGKLSPTPDGQEKKPIAEKKPRKQ